MLCFFDFYTIYICNLNGANRCIYVFFFLYNKNLGNLWIYWLMMDTYYIITCLTVNYYGVNVKGAGCVISVVSII